MRNGSRFNKNFRDLKSLDSDETSKWRRKKRQLGLSFVEISSISSQFNL